MGASDGAGAGAGAGVGTGAGAGAETGAGCRNPKDDSAGGGGGGGEEGSLEGLLDSFFFPLPPESGELVRRRRNFDTFDPTAMFMFVRCSDCLV